MEKKDGLLMFHLIAGSCRDKKKNMLKIKLPATLGSYSHASVSMWSDLSGGYKHNLEVYGEHFILNKS